MHHTAWFTGVKSVFLKIQKGIKKGFVSPGRHRWQNEAAGQLEWRSRCAPPLGGRCWRERALCRPPPPAVTSMLLAPSVTYHACRGMNDFHG